MPELPWATQPRLGSGSAWAGSNGNAQPRASPAGPGLTGSGAASAPPTHTRKWRAHGNGPRGTRSAQAPHSRRRLFRPLRPVLPRPPAVQGSGAVPGNGARSRRGARGGERRDGGPIPGEDPGGRCPGAPRSLDSWEGGEGRVAWRPQGGATAAPRSSRCLRPVLPLLSQVALRGQLAVGAGVCHPLPSVGAPPGVSAPLGCPSLPAESRSGGRPGVPAAKGPVSLS